MNATEHVPRFATGLLKKALSEDPVVLLHGPRQCGKTTLVRAVSTATDRTYVTFDDDVMRAAAAADPIGFVRDLPGPATLDEVQRVPGLFTTLKAAVDRDDYEVDIIVEQGAGAVAGVEVKAAATVTDGDFAGLRRLERAAGSDFVAGVVVYDGDTLVRFGERHFAVPVHALWRGD